jgi:integral membrane sensor domain MASE1
VRLVGGITVKNIILAGIGILVLSIIVPIAFENFFDVNTDGWDSGVAALWVIIPLAVVIYFVVKYLMASVSGTGGKNR